jgi:hypothetical protein
MYCIFSHCNENRLTQWTINMEVSHCDENILTLRTINMDSEPL